MSSLGSFRGETLNNDNIFGVCRIFLTAEDCTGILKRRYPPSNDTAHSRDVYGRFAAIKQLNLDAALLRHVLGSPKYEN